MKLPTSIEAEQAVLGSVLLDNETFAAVAGKLAAGDFHLEKHRRIYLRMSEMLQAGSPVDDLTLCETLRAHDQLQSCDGVAYIASLTEALPRLSNLAEYVRIVKDKATLRNLIATAEAISARCLDDGDTRSILASAEQSILSLGDRFETAGPLLLGKAIADFPGGVGALLDASKQPKGLQTGILKLDEMTGGLHGGQLVILAARPAMGKTALALCIAGATAIGDDPRPVILFSAEMSRPELLKRLLCSLAKVDSHRYRNSWLQQEERRRLHAALGPMTKAPLYIDDQASVNLWDIGARCRRIKAERGLSLIVIDYLQLLDSGSGENRTQQISSLTRGLKVLAKDLDVPILCLSQLSRAPETRPGDHRPILSDLRESGSIEQDADVVLFLYREEIYKPDREDLHGLAELIVAKQRNGPTGIVKMAFLGKYTRFENLAEDGFNDAEQAA